MRPAALLALAAALAAAPVEAYCPSYTLSSASNTHSCGVEAAPGTNPTLAQWQSIFSLVAQGPSAWGSAGPSVDELGQGCNRPEPFRKVPARFPCEVLKAIAMQESGWRQFCVPDRPSDQVGGPSRTLISFDCGYGVGQVTSGMHQGEAPGFDRARVASDPTYNLATGTRILASKWSITRCVGDNQPRVVEHWYSAVWAYNGLAYVNNPNNPVYSSSRGVYRPSVGGSAPYQEKVLGHIEHPPSEAHWKSVAVAYPDPIDVGGGSSPPELPEPRCVSPTRCTSTRPTHVSLCFPEGTADAGVDAGSETPDAGEADGGAEDPPDSGEPAQPFIDLDGGSEGASAPRQAALGEVSGGCGCGSGGSGLTLALLAWLGLAFRRARSVGEWRSGLSSAGCSPPWP